MSARQKHWSDLDIDWAEENFNTRETNFYKRLFQSNVQGQARSKYPIFKENG